MKKTTPVQAEFVEKFRLLFIFYDQKGGTVMRIAVSSTGTDLDSQIVPRFGRCAYFLIVETDDLNFDKPVANYDLEELYGCVEWVKMFYYGDYTI